MRLTITVLAFGMALPALCSAEDLRSEDRGTAERSMLETATAAYEGRWCIETFLANEKAERNSEARGSRVFSNYRPLRHGTVAEPTYSDQSSLLSRLKGLRNFRLATLWRGKDSALVLTVIDDAYVGVRLDEADHPGVRKPD